MLLSKIKEKENHTPMSVMYMPYDDYFKEILIISDTGLDTRFPNILSFEESIKMHYDVKKLTFSTDEIPRNYIKSYVYLDFDLITKGMNEFNRSNIDTEVVINYYQFGVEYYFTYVNGITSPKFYLGCRSNQPELDIERHKNDNNYRSKYINGGFKRGKYVSSEEMKVSQLLDKLVNNINYITTKDGLILGITYNNYVMALPIFKNIIVDKLKKEDLYCDETYNIIYLNGMFSGYCGNIVLDIDNYDQVVIFNRENKITEIMY